MNIWSFHGEVSCFFQLRKDNYYFNILINNKYITAGRSGREVWPVGYKSSLCGTMN
jgi:hypothetical protein